MITRLQLHNIGPAPDLAAEFGSRLNVVTGDNGLGKTFLLDACWFALTKRTWVRGREFYIAPEVGKADPPWIEYGVVGAGGKEAVSRAEYDFAKKRWLGRKGKPAKPGLVIYARVDGGFSVWDPARHYASWNEGEEAEVVSGERPPAFQFLEREVWNGLPEGATRLEEIVCNGLLRDVENWRLKGNGVFDLLQEVLAGVSAEEGEELRIGGSVPVGAVDIPTLTMPYGEVPVTHAAAGIRRVLSLAYLLVWAWEAHKRTAAESREAPAGRLVLLLDEVEAHLHPKWQRVFLPALLKVVEGLLGPEGKGAVQIIATTHAPLVLGSVEMLWNGDTDQLFDFDLEGGQVELEAIEFARHGSAENWLASDSFDLPDDYPGYPVEAVEAMRRADEFMQEYRDAAAAPLAEVVAVHARLQRTLGGDDEYWPYWLPYYDLRRKGA